MLKFYRYPDGKIVWIGSHNKDNHYLSTVYIDGEKVTLPYIGVMALPEFKTITTRSIQVVRQFYVNDNGVEISTEDYNTLLRPYYGDDGEPRDLKAKIAILQIKDEWHSKTEKEEVENPVEFEIYEVPSAHNKWQMPLRHFPGMKVNMFQLDRLGFAKTVVTELLEAEGLKFGRGFSWSEHSGLRFWKIHDKYVGTDYLEFEQEFIGTNEECHREMENIRLYITRIINKWKHQNSAVVGLGSVIDSLAGIYTGLRKLDVYKKDRDAYYFLLKRVRELKESLAAQLDDKD